MPIDVVPVFPLRSQGLTQALYSTGVENSLSAMPTFITQLNAIGSAYALTTNGTSATSVLIGTGAKTFTTQLNLGYMVGMTLRIANTSANYMTGEVTSYSTATGSLVMNITSALGSGTLASWTITMGAVGDLSTKANLTGATFTGAIIVPDQAYNATTWDNNLEAPTKNAVRDKFESLQTSSISQLNTSVSVTDTGTDGKITLTVDGVIISEHDDVSRKSVIDGGTSLVPYFHCRAFVNFNGTGTVAIRASGNVSSITDDALGEYTVNLSTAMPDANYSVSGTARNAGTTCILVPFLTGAAVAADPLAGSFKIQTRTANTAALTDCAYVNISVFR